jgi:hypothetical protein
MSRSYDEVGEIGRQVGNTFVPSAVCSASGSVVFDADSPVNPGLRECAIQASR